MDWKRAANLSRGIAIELAGKALGWLIILAGLWLAVSVIIGSVVLANRIVEVVT